MINPKSALALFQTISNKDLTLINKFKDGETGAYQVIDQSNHQQFVLKIYDYPQAAIELRQIQTYINTLVSRGYPVSQITNIASNEQFTTTLQTYVSGQLLEPLAPNWLETIFHINTLQKDIVQNPSDWPKRLIDTLLLSAKGYCHHESLENYSPQTKNILHQLKNIGHSSVSIKCPNTDLVHFDFHGGNILTQGHQITGVIDWAGACIGDRLFDLTTLAYYDHSNLSIRQPIEAEILKHIPKATLKLYYAHMILRQLDWSIRHHSSRAVEIRLKTSQQILEDYA